MAINVNMPQLGDSIIEGVINKWMAQEGDKIKRSDPLLEVGSEKIDTEVPSPSDGVILKLCAAEGEVVEVGTLIAVIGEQGEIIPDLPASSVRITPLIAPAKVGTSPIQPSPAILFISPVVARLAAEHNVDLAQVAGTGINGRIRKVDVLNYVKQIDFVPTAIPSDDQIVPMNRKRRQIAEHMVHSKRTSPHVTTVFDCDLSAVVRHRYANVETFAQDGVHLTFTPYFIFTIVRSLKLNPYVNSTWSDQGILLKQAINIGLATAIDDGLVVPVIKNADALDLLELAQRVTDLTNRTRSGQLSPDDLQDGTFTLTNHGTSGSLFATPIINQPQTGILGVGKIHKAPVVLSQGHPLLPDVDDAIAIRPIVFLSFTFDHRVLDGAAADAFVTDVKAQLEFWPDA